MDRNNACMALACERDGALEHPDVLYSVNRLSDYSTLNSDLNRELSADPSHAQIGSDSLGYSRCWLSLGIKAYCGIIYVQMVRDSGNSFSFSFLSLFSTASGTPLMVFTPSSTPRI